MLYAWILLPLLTGCGLNRELKTRAENVPARIDKAMGILEKYRDEFNRYMKTDEYKSEFYRYAAAGRENWENNFTLSDNEIGRAQDIYKNAIRPILERNDRKEERELVKQLGKIDVALKDGAKLARKTSLRISALRGAKKNAGDLAKKAENESAETKKIFTGLESYIEENQEQFPNKKADLAAKLSQVVPAKDDTEKAITQINSEMSSAAPDYAVFLADCAIISRSLSRMKDQNETLRKKIGELGRDYSKILRDMKIEQKPWVEEVKYQWNNWSDFDTTREVYRRKRYVSMDEYKRIMNRFGEDGGIIAKGSDYEIWIEGADIEEHYFHKYLIVENDKEKNTDWIEVSEKTYEDNEENLNMSIVSKPFGYYEDEAVRVAAPPGFDKVGNPRYGRWVENRETGHREWSFFERYLFWHMILNGVGPRHNYYTYGRWNDWNRNYRGRRAYYGTGGIDFGSSGRTTSSNPTVRNSTFSRSGGFKAANTGLRGAGSSVRGRGPGSGK